MLEEINLPDKKVLLLGTAHISAESITEVRDAIAQHQPDVVCVELCQARFDALKNPDRWKEMNIVDVVKQGKAPLLLANLALSAFQKKMGDQLGVKPGAEMAAAVEAAETTGAEVVLADRDVTVTLKRSWGRLGFFEKLKAISQLVASSFEKGDVTAEEVENLKETDVLSESIEEMAKQMPVVKEVLIDERDQYLAEKIRSTEGKVVLAVVGAGHMPGIKKWITQEVDLEPLLVIPPPSGVVTALKYLIPLGILAMIGYGFYAASGDVSIEMLKRWVLVNGVLAAAGAALAGGHILTVFVAFVAAPFTSLNPAIAAGWVSGLTEAWVRKPKVSDFETLGEDVTSLRGFWSNEITRILLVVVFSNLGSTLGTLIGIPLLASLL